MDRINKQGVMESRMQFIFCEERRVTARVALLRYAVQKSILFL